MEPGVNKLCNGLVGREAHYVPADRFGKDKHRKDGLMQYCKDCMKAYHQSRRPAKVENTGPGKLTVVPPLPKDTEVETEQGQQALAANAELAQKARRAAAAEARRRQRAAAKERAAALVARAE